MPRNHTTTCRHASGRLDATQPPAATPQADSMMQKKLEWSKEWVLEQQLKQVGSIEVGLRMGIELDQADGTLILVIISTSPLLPPPLPRLHPRFHSKPSNPNMTTPSQVGTETDRMVQRIDAAEEKIAKSRKEIRRKKKEIRREKARLQAEKEKEEEEARAAAAAAAAAEARRRRELEAAQARTADENAEAEAGDKRENAGSNEGTAKSTLDRAESTELVAAPARPVTPSTDASTDADAASARPSLQVDRERQDSTRKLRNAEHELENLRTHLGRLTRAKAKVSIEHSTRPRYRCRCRCRCRSTSPTPPQG